MTTLASGTADRSPRRRRARARWWAGLGAGRGWAERRRRSRRSDVVDLSAAFPTMCALTEDPDPAAAAASADGPALAALEELVGEHRARHPRCRAAVAALADRPARGQGRGRDLPGVDARAHHRGAGARRRRGRRTGIRSTILDAVGGDAARRSCPDRPRAARLKACSSTKGCGASTSRWESDPDAEMFTKAPVLATVGAGVDVGMPRRFGVEQSRAGGGAGGLVAPGRIVGAALGNDVNLRDIEGRSRAAPRPCEGQQRLGIGRTLHPPVRRRRSALDDVRAETVTLTVDGAGRVHDAGELAYGPDQPRSRGPRAVRPSAHITSTRTASCCTSGTMFAPNDDRDETGRGFTHHLDDIVRISSPRLGTLVNRVRRSEQLPPWKFGIGALMSSLAARGLIGAA